ncbi:MAG: penicillin-binding transpeptidase domain-containing protein [Actinomycetota bacterium]|nr:penicillin-binding transpeptidase domain-containing protein [Actinomycetota bacterium]
MAAPIVPMRRVAAAACAALLATACPSNPGPEVPSPRGFAAGFVEAWNDKNAAAMRSSMTSPEGSLQRLERFFERTPGPGLDFEVELNDVTFEEPESEDDSRSPGSGAVGVAHYSIVYSSDEVPGTKSLEGSLEMGFSFHDGWTVAWDEAAMWPGYEEASGLRATRRWPRRAAILDRKGRVLARGPAAARRYPFGAAAGSTVGHVGTLTRDEAAHVDRYEPGDLAGASGMEEAFDERLAGAPGLRLEVVDGRKPLTTLLRAPPDPGRSVKTTLDMRLHQAAAAAYGATTGGAVVLDPATGDLLAVVSSAELNPEDYVGARDVQPFNRALSGLYPPGSSLKVMTGAAALETGVVRPGTRLTGPAEYKGVRNFESGEFGTLDFATAVRFSVNTAFAQVAEDLGAKRLTRYARSFGFNRPPEMALGAATPSFPRPEDEGDLMWGSIGQAQVLTTPLQMATVAATIANGGRRMEPRISMRVRPAGKRVVSRRTAATMTRLMEDVVAGGTGVAARIPGVGVAGKTGTAEVDVAGKRRNHAWFVAFAPSGEPALAVAVVAELGGVGGQVAAPLARAILQATLPLAR